MVTPELLLPLTDMFTVLVGAGWGARLEPGAAFTTMNDFNFIPPGE
jgi:hypothetical protein